MSIRIIKEVQNFDKVVEKLFPHVSHKELNHGVLDLMWPLAVIRAATSFLQQGGTTLQETLFPPQLKSKFTEHFWKILFNLPSSTAVVTVNINETKNWPKTFRPQNRRESLSESPTKTFLGNSLLYILNITISLTMLSEPIMHLNKNSIFEDIFYLKF